MDQSPGAARAAPLRPGDPPRLGSVILTGRLEETDAGVAYAAEHDAEPVVVIMLGEGAERDSYARARFTRAVDDIRAHDQVLVVDSDEDDDIAPWVAMRSSSPEEGLPLARQVLTAVTLADLPPGGRPSGPDFRPHWLRGRGAGRWRLWPLPWPSALTAAGRWTFVVAFGLVVAIASIALWLAIQVFEDQPPSPFPPPPQPGPITEPPPPPTPTPSPSPTPSPPTGPRPTGGSPDPSLPTLTTTPPIV